MRDSTSNPNLSESWDKVSPQLMSLPEIRDERGALGFVQTGLNCPFPIRRIYYMYDLSAGVERGAHAHRRCMRQLIAMAGQVMVRLETAAGLTEYRLDSRDMSLLVPPQAWITYLPLTADAVLLALASEPYDESDYIRNRQEFENTLRK